MWAGVGNLHAKTGLKPTLYEKLPLVDGVVKWATASSRWTWCHSNPFSGGVARSLLMEQGPAR